MHLKKPSWELVFDLINEANGSVFLPRHFSIGAPSVVNVRGRNTTAVLEANGVEYFGTQDVFYNRLDLAVKMPPNEVEGLELMVPNDGFINTVEIADRLNQMFDLALSGDDLVDQTITFDTYPASMSLQAKPSSLAWFGTLNIRLVPDRPMFTEAFQTTALDGFKIPELTYDELAEPYVKINRTLTLTNNDVMYYNGLPATDFLVCSNDELYVAASPRAGDGTASEPAEVGGYVVGLTTGQPWVIALSAHLSRLPGSATRLTQAYDITIDITAPGNTQMSWKLVDHNDALCLQTTINGAQHFVQTGIEINGGQSWQGVLDMKAIAPLFPSLPLDDGVPRGSFLIRLQARRCNSLTPRLLASFITSVGDVQAPVARLPNEINNLSLWLDFTDPNQLSAATGNQAPITTKHQVVRRVMDRSGGTPWIYSSGNHALWNPQASGNLGGVVFTRNNAGAGPLFRNQLNKLLEEYVGLSDKTIVLVGRFRSRTPDTIHFAFGDHDKYFTVEIYNRNFMLRNWPEGEVYQELFVPGATGVMESITTLHDGRKLMGRVDDGVLLSFDADPTQETRIAQLGTFDNGLDMTICHVIAYPRRLSSRELASLQMWIGPQYGAEGYVEQLPTAFTQSHVYDVNLKPTLTNMRDGDRTTGAGVGNGASMAWIRADLGELKSVSRIDVQGGDLASWGPVGSYLNVVTLQCSDDDSTWTTVTANTAWPSDITDDAYQGPVRVLFAPRVARYWRMTRQNWLSTTRFQFFD